MPPAARAQLPGLLVALTDTGGAFTVVQRVGGYRGYGGVNAPVRIAAQQAASAAAAGAADVPAGRGRQ